MCNMFGIESLHGSFGATLTIGLVLTEAIALYVGYGALTRTVGSRMLNTLRGT